MSFCCFQKNFVRLSIHLPFLLFSWTVNGETKMHLFFSFCFRIVIVRGHLCLYTRYKLSDQLQRMATTTDKNREKHYNTNKFENGTNNSTDRNRKRHKNLCSYDSKTNFSETIKWLYKLISHHDHCDLHHMIWLNIRCPVVAIFQLSQYFRHTLLCGRKNKV